MVKKIFSLTAMVLFSASLMSVSNTRSIEVTEDCFDDAIVMMEVAMEVGESIETATCLGNVAYAQCSGHKVAAISCFTE